MAHTITSSLILALTTAATSFAKPVPLQTYEQLMEASDVVAIVDASPPEDVDGVDEALGDRYQQMETELNVHLLFKGAAEQSTLTFVHCRIKDRRAWGVIGGPRLLLFETKGKS